MLTFDLHYHANIHGLRKSARLERLRRHRLCLASSGVDVVASTEHSYKKPRQSYLHLADACQGLLLSILPGVECISREGVDLIFLYPEENLLEKARRTFAAYSWTTGDAGQLARDTGGLLIVPHPFGLGTACAGNILSPLDYARLLDAADYVEIHNGAALLSSLLLKKSGSGFFPGFAGRCQANSCLPVYLRGDGLGWSIGSDAHFPGEQYVVGGVEADAFEGPYSLLVRKVRFEPVWVQAPPDRISERVRSVVMSGQCAAREGVVKRLGKLGGLGEGYLKQGFLRHTLRELWAARRMERGM
jgi:hypothetical protein